MYYDYDDYNVLSSLKHDEFRSVSMIPPTILQMGTEALYVFGLSVRLEKDDKGSTLIRIGVSG